MEDKKTTKHMIPIQKALLPTGTEERMDEIDEMIINAFENNKRDPLVVWNDIILPNITEVERPYAAYSLGAVAGVEEVMDQLLSKVKFN